VKGYIDDDGCEEEMELRRVDRDGEIFGPTDVERLVGSVNSPLTQKCETSLQKANPIFRVPGERIVHLRRSNHASEDEQNATV